MKKKYICPTTKVLKMDVGYGIMAGSGGGTVSNPLSKPDPFESTSSTPSTASFDLWNDTEVAE